MGKIIRLTENDLSRIVRRVIMEQEAKPDLIGKTISIYKDSSLSELFATIKVDNIELKDNGIQVSFNGVKGSNDMAIINDMNIKCNSNLVTMSENTAGFGGGGSSKQVTGYVSKKLVDYLKPFICNSSPKQLPTPSDF